jgi:Ala-tRNA(Pro) deacylase
VGVEPPVGLTTYERFLAQLDAHGARYRLIDHAPEGRTEIVSQLRPNELHAAAKCIVLITKLGKKQTQYVLAVVPGDARVDFDAVRAHLGATYVAFASPEIAERLSGSPLGTVLPLPMDPSVRLLVDPAVLRNPELFFNVARLDRSMALVTADYVTLAKPETAAIARR